MVPSPQMAAEASKNTKETDMHNRMMSKKEQQQQEQQATGVTPKTNNGKRRAATMMAPMTREQHEIQRSRIREVYDAQSGRYRLVRGNGVK